jgi:hypothetical protein
MMLWETRNRYLVSRGVGGDGSFFDLVAVLSGYGGPSADSLTFVLRAYWPSYIDMIV